MFNHEEVQNYVIWRKMGVTEDHHVNQTKIDAKRQVLHVLCHMWNNVCACLCVHVCVCVYIYTGCCRGIIRDRVTKRLLGFFCLFVFLLVLGFELKALHLLGMCFTWAILPAQKEDIWNICKSEHVTVNSI
jgi:hypothetical protein